MQHYHNFIGIDIGKFSFVVAVNEQQETQEFENNSAGIAEFIMKYKEILCGSLCVVETTGGYELSLAYTLIAQNVAVHRADTRKVKNFIRSFGNKAKTDRLDAKALAKYGAERVQSLDLFKLRSPKSLELFQLTQRQADLTQMLVAEKNRQQAPSISKLVQETCQQLIECLSKQLKEIKQKIQEFINSDPTLSAMQGILKTIPGIGEKVSADLLVLLPELGTMNRRQIASLCGLAPLSNDSGRLHGYRRTYHGRGGVKPTLFMAAMAARQSKSHFGEFYDKLIGRGKKKMVALVAVMRKIIVTANAKIRDFLNPKPVEGKA